MLEKMDDFFTARANGYDEHMKSNIVGASAFYKYTASLLPTEKKAKVLDLGCGTGLELEEFFCCKSVWQCYGDRPDGSYARSA
ncbi:hypothetical protein [Butyrivibrio sp. AE3003]|uniref:hypothetical protein n=1 Tax=Butyrivibrio sp. AE3003 TaxID=1496721 RepID=UPI00068F06F8|nr:hypothetical protein [Butyrivibrio sp. AE3003]